MKLKDIRRILTNKNEITLYYKVDDEIVPVFKVTREIKGGKARLKIMFGINIKKKLLEFGFKKIIIGYFNYLDIYDHSVNCRSVSGWRYSNPFVLDLESGLVTYEVLRNNEKLPYVDVKLKDNKLMIAKNVPSMEEYGYILDTLDIY